MAGVEILNTIYEYESLMNPCWFVLCLFLMLLIGIAGLFTVNCDIIQEILTCCFILLIPIAFGCLIGMSIETDEIIDTKYEVIISDEVLMNEFSEKYEIIEQNGKIYTVKERDYND